MTEIRKRIRAVFFALDETLLDDDRCMREALARTCHALNELYPQIEPGKLQAAYLQVSDQWWLSSGSVPRTSDSGSTNGRDIRIEVWSDALKAYGLPDQDLAVKAADLYSQERRAGYCLFPDVGEVLDALHQRFILGVITNGPGDTQIEKVQVTGIAPYLRVFAVSGVLRVGKPEPGIFLRALEYARCPPGQALYVGDSLTSDIVGAKGVGMYAVWINRKKIAKPQNVVSPDLEIKGLRELLPLFGSGKTLVIPNLSF